MIDKQKRSRLKWEKMNGNSDLRPNVRDLLGFWAICIVGYVLAVLIMSF